MTTINKVPVLLLTGYLGSGKTTLLNRILTNTKGIRFAVIVNDIGEVNIDASLIQQGGVVSQQDDSLVALQNGCICCSLKMDLIAQLHDLVAQKAYDYIVIEASGICEPAPIAQTICSYPEMVPQFAMDGVPVLDCICAVVDALRLRDEFDGGLALEHHIPKEEDLAALVTEQIEFCNVILLNKASDVSADELGLIRKIIKTLQPKAEIIETNYCDVDLDRILNTKMFDFDDVATSAAWIHEIEGHHEEDDDDDDDDDEEDEHHHGHHHHHHHHDEGEAEEYGIGTFVYYRRDAFNLGLFDEFVARHWPSNVIRAKGICWFQDEPDVCYVFEQAGKQFSIRNAGQWYATMPKDELKVMMDQNPGLRRDWDEKYGDRMLKLVFIGQNLDKEKIAEELDNCLERLE